MQEKDLKKYYHTQLIIWASMAISGLVFLVVGRFVIYDSVIAREPADVEVLRYAFGAFAVGAPMISIAVMRRVLASDRWDGLTGTDALAPFGINAVVPAAVNELVAVFGLVLFVLAGEEFDLYAFVMLSLTYHFIFMPKYSVLKRWAEHKGLAGTQAGKGN